MEKKLFIDALKEGQQVDDLFLVKSVRLAETRAGKPYLQLVFADRSGDIGGPAWDNAEALEKICIPGKVVRVSGAVQIYRDKLQLRVDHIEAADQANLKMENYLAASSRNPASMESELDQRLSEIADPFLSKLLHKIFHQTEVGERFQHAPAAKGIHHAYRGGLLEHSLSMARVASLLAGHYQTVEKDLVIAGALLHDIGKTVELQSEVGVIDYTDIGRLKGHVVIGSEFLASVAAEIEDFPKELLVHLQHLVLSHHGRQEFGSPVVPMTAEALLLSFIDDMDAKMSLVDQLSTKLKADGPTWSDYQRSLERYILLKPTLDGSDHAETKAEDDGPGSTRQHTLF
ncbi:MAG: HD domain-containing protein [Desulfofustis sp.]|nr:HD domain-containing protein [Desulfofustis sp.]